MQRPKRGRIQRAVFLAVAPVVAGVASAQTLSALPLGELSQVRSINRISSIPAYAVSVPLAGFTPQVVFELTDEHDPGDLEFAAQPSTTPGGTIMPGGGPTYYATGVLDSGSASHIISWEDAANFNFDSVNRVGAYDVQLSGAGTLTETADITDAVGVYVSGFAGANRVSGTPVITGAVTGQTNTSVVTTRQDENSIFPNLIGTPLLAQHQTLIDNSKTYRLKNGTQILRSPQISFSNIDNDLNSPTPPGYSKFISTQVLSALGTSDSPTYFPSFDNPDDWSDNPSAPTFWANFYNDVTVNHHDSNNTATTDTDQFLLDTGAQISVLSTPVANALGIKTGTNPTPPDFTVELQGVGGHRDNVPGYYVDGLTIKTDNNDLVFNHVPVVVVNFTDPRDDSGPVPGIIGMNLFNDRNIIINGGLNNPFIAVSTNPFTPQWSKGANGLWSEDESWVMGVPDGEDLPANFLQSATALSITVDGNYTMGSIHFDSTGSYTINGTGTLTLATSGAPAEIHASTGSHTISAPINVTAATSIQVDQAAATLTLGKLVNASQSITKAGPGTLTIAGPQSNSAGSRFDANEGTTNFNTDAGSTNSANLAVSVLANLNMNTTQHLASLSVGAAGRAKLATQSTSGMLYVNSLSITSGGSLDLANNGLVVNSGSFQTIQNLVFSGFRSGPDPSASGIVSSTSQADGGNEILVLFDNALVQSPDWPPGSGNTISNTAIVGRYTYFGDTNLDGMVTADDYGALDANWGAINIPPGMKWIVGDLNFDGMVTADDYGALDANFGRGVGHPVSAQALVQAVPEPVMLAPMALVLLVSQRRRRKNFGRPVDADPSV